MIALDRLRQDGFVIKPSKNGNLYVEPIDELSETRRQWLIANKPQIRQQLLSERWHWFLSLATDQGINPVVVAAEFPTDTDRLDVIEPVDHTNDHLVKWMATLCRDPRVRQRQQDYEAGRWVPVDPNGEVAL